MQDTETQKKIILIHSEIIDNEIPCFSYDMLNENQ